MSLDPLTPAVTAVTGWYERQRWGTLTLLTLPIAVASVILRYYPPSFQTAHPFIVGVSSVLSVVFTIFFFVSFVYASISRRWQRHKLRLAKDQQERAEKDELAAMLASLSFDEKGIIQTILDCRCDVLFRNDDPGISTLLAKGIIREIAGTQYFREKYYQLTPKAKTYLEQTVIAKDKAAEGQRL